MISAADMHGFEGTYGDPVSVDEGIRIMIMGSTYAMEREDSMGSIEVGKHADFSVLDRNLFELSPETMHDTVVLKTIFSGDVVYDAE